MIEDMTRDTGTAAAKAAPAVAVVSAKAGGLLSSIDPANLVQWLTAVYIVLMASHLVWGWSRELMRSWRRRA